MPSLLSLCVGPAEPLPVLNWDLYVVPVSVYRQQAIRGIHVCISGYSRPVLDVGAVPSFDVNVVDDDVDLLYRAQYSKTGEYRLQNFVGIRGRDI